MCAALHHLAFGKDDNLVGAGNGVEAVGDDQGGAALQQPVERLTQPGFVLWVQVGGGFVQDDERRVFQESARQGDALRLPAAQTSAALADGSVVTLGQAAR